MTAYNPAHPFLPELPEGSIAVTGRDSAKGSPALGFMGKKYSPESDDDVIPAEITILVENTLNGPRIPALYTEARGTCRGKLKTDMTSCPLLLALEETILGP